ncbi:Ku protein [Rhodococcus triatomae]|uniref:Non-homologous end joining protein Ku n=1 Tax=Rhodococcus triatomae TaxID=300028 RepID=A0A1G8KAG7_9NOCA|nr:Ku protein [Rhodococcus triatomae]QNG18866.1 Ku protein [Rhodococcus triatomae]QNG25222.1 Ku protein [Rhodococcus triatomae]SDI40411.1 DNA end-binding protein Ku [Rhodococcus triatomae]
MRSIWKGSIAFGLVNVPVKVYSATEDHDIRFHQVHAKDGGRIKYQRVCSVDGEVVPYADIDKAYESEDGVRVILTDEDFAELPAAEKHEIPVLEFVPNDQIDPILFEKSYYLEPDGSSPKAYVLLATTLEDTDRTAIVHFTLRQRTRLAAMRSRDGVLVIQTLLWPDEVREVSFPSLDGAEKPQKKELAMAGTLVESMSADFTPEDFTDEYQEQLRALLDEMIASGGKKVIATEEAAEPGQDAEVVDLVAALQRSVEAAGGGKSESRTSAKKATRKAPARTTTTKKAPTKETGARKSPAKKTAAKKTDERKRA